MNNLQDNNNITEPNHDDIDPFENQDGQEDFDPFSNQDDNDIDPFSNQDDINPFSNQDDNEAIKTVAKTFTNKIELCIITTGKKSNTYITYWDISDEELKEHLKVIKIKKGCSGSIKKETSGLTTLHLQGNLKKFMIEYFSKLGINESLLSIKG